MNDTGQSVKKALLYGFAGALLFPLVYECYANVMQGLAIFIAAAGCVFVAVKLFPYKCKDALPAIAFFIVISAGLGLFLEIMAHDSVVSFLEKNSKYFHLSFKETVYFAAKIFVCYLLSFIVYLGKVGITSAAAKIRSNGEKTADYIDNAFDDDNEE